MREDEAFDGRFLSDPSAVSCMHMVRARTIGGKRAIQDRRIDAFAKTDKGFTVLRVSGIGQGMLTILDSITDAAEFRGMLHSSRYDSGLPDLKILVGDLLDLHAEGRRIESGKCVPHHVEDPLRSVRSENG